MRVQDLFRFNHTSNAAGASGRNIGRCLPATSQSVLVFCAVVAVTFTISATSMSADPLRTNTTSFRIPFEVESTRSSPARGTAILFSSVNGAPMEQTQRVDADKRGFDFNAPRDGRYAFAVRMTDASGKLSDEAAPLIPELEVIVDTTAPKMNIQVTENAPGRVVIAWNSDSAVTPGSVRLEYAEGLNGRWQPLAEATEATGSVSIQTSPGTSVSVRGFLTDLAGNEGTASAQTVLSTPSTTNSSGTKPIIAVPDQVDLRGSNENSEARGPVMGPNPFSNSNQQNSNVPPIQGMIDHSGAPAEQGILTTNPPAFPATPLQYPNQLTQQNGVGANPVVGVPLAAPQNSGGGFAGQLQPYGATAGGQLVKSRVFDIAYQVEDVGPSGVSAVELFVTENGGQQWFRYGKDIDLRTPFQVDTRGEGTFGFAVRVYNGLGFSDPPPQPGEIPSIVVTVDQTPPVVRLGQPQIVTTGQGQVVINWQVADKNPSDTPVRLEYSGSPSGPWTPLFDWQADQRGFQLPIQSGISSGLYFRLLARDAAGNVATAQTPQPIIIDQHRPHARLLRIQPAAFQQSF